MGESLSSRFVAGIDANRTVKDALAEAVNRNRGRVRIGVTDLVNMRQAYFRWTHPEIVPSPERQRVMMAGTGFHDEFGRAVSTEEFVEQFVELDGVVGKIDIYEDIPTELKTTGSIPVDIALNRPSYVDQLGMYCAMTGREHGRLVVYRRARWSLGPQLRVYDVTYRSLERIAAEMRDRRDRFRDALDRRDPSGLPRCEWFGPGCDYSKLCGCGSADPGVPVVGANDVHLEEDSAFAAVLAEQVANSAGMKPEGFRLNDLVFPRRAAFERAVPPEDEDEPAAEERLLAMQRMGFEGALRSALWFGLPGEFSRTGVRLRSLSGMVGLFRGVPTILRTNRRQNMVHRDRLTDELSHYFDRVAFECALSGHERGRVIIYYEAIPEERFMVYDVAFRDVPAIKGEADRRLSLLEAGASPSALPPCPEWMGQPRYCKYAPGCGCGGDQAEL